MQKKKTSSRVAKPAKKRSSRVSKQTRKRSLNKVPGQSTRKRSVATSGTSSKQSRGEGDKRPILIPVDFSPYSQAALEYAGLLAEGMQWPVVVLHVVHDPGEAPGYYQRVTGRKKQLRRLEDLARELLDKFMVKMVERYRNYTALGTAKRVLVTGLPVTRILEVAERVPSMVVMGSAGRTGLSRLLLGSKTEQVLRMCPFPVTIVKMSEDEQ